MSVDISKIKPGDEVVAKVKVHSVFQGRVYTQTAEKTQAYTYYEPGDIIGHIPLPRPLSVGDRVWGLSTKADGTVRHVIGELAWVEFEDGRHEIVLPDQVERAA